MRRLLAGVLTGALLLGCSGGSSSKRSVTTTLPESVVNNGTTTAIQVIERLTRAGMPIGLTTPHPTDDPVFQDFDDLLGKVDFKDTRLLSTKSDIDEAVDGGSVEVYRDERAAISASHDRGGYVFVVRNVLLHLATELAPEWVIAYRNALTTAVP